MYAAIDMKSFYSSVECVERGLNPLTENLVVADVSRTNKTICLAVSPSLKAIGIPGRPRLFEVEKLVSEWNEKRYEQNGYRPFLEKSADSIALQQHPEYELDYRVAVPRMALYEDYSARIYSVFLRFFSAEDIHVYSCDEAFIYLAPYLSLYKQSAHDLVMTVIREILRETGITATAGIGTNLYLAKVAMDIVAKKMPPDENGVRIAELDELEYRKQLWEHTPLTDFWEVGKGVQQRLHELGLYTMGDICLMSEQCDKVLYKKFGIDAGILIDHAWGYEDVTIQEIKQYEPKSKSISTGQVLSRAYSYEEAKLVLKEMVDERVLKLNTLGYATCNIGLQVEYDGKAVDAAYHGAFAKDRYGRRTPKPVQSSKTIAYTASYQEILLEMLSLFQAKVNQALFIHKITISLNRLIPEQDVPRECVQYDLFNDTAEIARQAAKKEARLAQERSLQSAVIAIKERYGKNAVLKGMSFLDGATARERNRQIGGHQA